jgi:integrase
MRLAAGPLWQDTGLVFTTETGRSLDHRFIQRLFDLACQRVGIARRTIKETRHTFATLGLVRNIPVKVISEALGHASVVIIYDVYSHVIVGLQDDSMGYLDGLFSQGTG